MTASGANPWMKWCVLMSRWCHSRGRAIWSSIYRWSQSAGATRSSFILADQHGIVYNFDVYTGSIQPCPGFPDIVARGKLKLKIFSVRGSWITECFLCGCRTTRPPPNLKAVVQLQTACLWKWWVESRWGYSYIVRLYLTCEFILLLSKRLDTQCCCSSLPQLKNWESRRGKEREGGRERKEGVHKKQLCDVFMSVTYSTHTDSEMLIWCRYDYLQAVFRSIFQTLTRKARHNATCCSCRQCAQPVRVRESVLLREFSFWCHRFASHPPHTYIHTYIHNIYYIHQLHTYITYIHYTHTYITYIHNIYDIHQLHTYITYILLSTFQTTIRDIDSSEKDLCVMSPEKQKSSKIKRNKLQM